MDITTVSKSWKVLIIWEHELQDILRITEDIIKFMEKS